MRNGISKEAHAWWAKQKTSKLPETVKMVNHIEALFNDDARALMIESSYLLYEYTKEKMKKDIIEMLQSPLGPQNDQT